MSRRVLIVSPHFPPDSSAGTHRARLLAAHLPACGWEPIVLTVDPRDYTTRLDPRLEGLTPLGLRVVRARAWDEKLTRRLGVGDLGLRSLHGIAREADRLLGSERFDVVFITTYPVYPALLGPRLKRRHGITFVLDLQDPWVGSWGHSVGGGAGGTVDLKSRASRLASLALEARVAPNADAITAVSRGTFEELAARHDAVARLPFLELPIGGDPNDLALVDALGGVNHVFTPGDGCFHLCAVGTLLPRGQGVLRALFGGLRRLRADRPDLYAKVRVHFVGTSNQTATGAEARALAAAAEAGVTDIVSEITPRVDYLDALAIQRDANALLLLGSDEPHYTASKIYPALIVNRPIVAVYHPQSSVIGVLRAAGDDPPIEIVEARPSAKLDEEIASALRAVMTERRRGASDPQKRLGATSAAALAARLAGFLESLPLAHAAA